MIWAKVVSDVKPSARARVGAKSCGHVCTRAAMAGSGVRVIRATALWPAAARRASICSATVAERPGMFRLRWGSSIVAVRLAA